MRCHNAPRHEPLYGVMGLATVGPLTAALRQAVDGDETAFARIVAAYHGDMIRVAYGICGDADMARDAVQAAWLIAWRKLRTVREPEHLRSWLVAVAANEARHVVRRRIRIVEIAMDEPGRDLDPDPEDGISRVDLVNALSHLKPDDRAVVALRYGADLDSTEIGARLGVSAPAVRTRLVRILSHLRKELDDVRG